MNHAIRTCIFAALCIMAGCAMADVTVTDISPDHVTDLPRPTRSGSEDVRLLTMSSFDRPQMVRR
jgi:hypothetical protein